MLTEGLFSLSEFNINDIGDKMLKERLKNKASELGIFEGELIDKLILTGLNDGEYCDEKYTSNLTNEERIRRLKNAYNDDLRKGIRNDQGNFEELIKLVKLRNGQW